MPPARLQRPKHCLHVAIHAKVAFVSKADAAVGTYQEGHAAGQQAEEGAAVGLVNSAIGVGEQGERQLVFLLKGRVRTRIIPADARNPDALRR